MYSFLSNQDISPAPSLPSSCPTWLLPAPLSVLMSLIGLISQGVPEVLVGEEGPRHLVDVVVGADGSEVFNVVPEVSGGIGPVGKSWWFIIWY